MPTRVYERSSRIRLSPLKSLTILALLSVGSLVAVGGLVIRTTHLEIEALVASWDRSQRAALESKAGQLDRQLRQPLSTVERASTVDEIAEAVLTLPDVSRWVLLDAGGRVLAPSSYRSRPSAEFLVRELQALTRPTMATPNVAAEFGRAAALLAAEEYDDAAEAYWDLRRTIASLDLPGPVARAWDAEVLDRLAALPNLDASSRVQIEEGRARSRREADWLRTCRSHLRDQRTALVGDWCFFSAEEEPAQKSLIAARRIATAARYEDRPFLFLHRTTALPKDSVHDLVTHGPSEASLSVALPSFVSTTDRGVWRVATRENGPDTASVERRGRRTLWIVIAATFALIGAIVAMLVSERKRARLEQLRLDLATNISHELRTPLSTLRLSAETLLARDVDAETRERYLRTIVRETEQLNDLVDDVVAITKDPTDNDRERVPVDLGALIQDALASFRPRLERAEFEVELRSPDEPLIVTGCPARLARAMINLFDNATVHAADGQYLGVSLRADGTLAVIEVTDHGPGVPPAERDAIFDRFRRLERSLTARTRGLGVGLSITREIVTQHGGSIECVGADTDRVGRGSVDGTCFRIRLPLTEGAHS